MKSLANHFLLPTAQMNDPRFFDTLIYLCRHGKEGAWGLIVNQPSSFMSVGGLLADMNIDGGHEAMNMPAMNGGVLRPEAGFVLHTGLPVFESSFAISENICLTTSRDILTKLAPVSCFAHYMLLMGFCTWRTGQLEKELEMGDWLSCPATAGILFESNHHKKIDLVYEQLGICPDFLSPVIGQA